MEHEIGLESEDEKGLSPAFWTFDLEMFPTNTNIVTKIKVFEVFDI